MVAVETSGAAAAGAGAEARVLRPPEEVISLEGADEVPVQRPEGRWGGRGRGSGRSGRARGRGPAPRRHELGEALRKYTRPGPPRAPRVTAETPQATRSELNYQLRRRERQDREAVFRLAKDEILQTAEAGLLEAEGRERTTQLTQAELGAAVPVGVARKRFSFDVPYGPYLCSYTSNGQYLLTGGRKGQVAMLHCEKMQISTELQLQETVRAVQTLHNQAIFAVAQKKYVYMYDQQGIELHCLKEHRCPSHLEFLPYHYLLITSGEYSDLRYRDISTGQEVCVHKMRLGPTRSLRQNPRNAVVHVGHSNGTVTLWTPNVKEPVVKMLCHDGHVTSLAVHGDYMVSSGADGRWKVWDLRKYDTLHTARSYGHAVSDVDVSMTGLLAIGFGPHLQIWKDTFRGGKQVKAYMTEEYHGRTVSSVRFRPYEDILAVGHSHGFANIIVPGAGFANFDSYEANPFETRKQRREKEVRSLLEKLQPESIMLDPTALGGIDKMLVKKYREEADKKKEQEEKEAAKKAKPRKKMRGKGKVGKRMRKKQLEKGKGQRAKTRARIRAEERGEGAVAAEASDSSEDDAESDDDPDEAPEVAGGKEPRKRDAGAAAGALGRFYGKRRRKT